MLPISDAAVLPVGGLVLETPAAVLIAIGFVVLAIGAPGELGVAAESRVGRAGLLTAALDRVLVLAWQAVPPGPDGVAPGWTIVVATSLPLLFALALLVSGVVVVRKAVLGGAARWALLALGAVEVGVAGMELLPIAEPAVGLWLATWPIEVLRPVGLVVTALLLLLHGRTEAVKHGARLFDDAW